MKFDVELLCNFGNGRVDRPADLRVTMRDWTGDCWDRLWPKAVRIITVGYIIRPIP
jgi:hypothetical protein